MVAVSCESMTALHRADEQPKRVTVLSALSPATQALQKNAERSGWFQRCPHRVDLEQTPSIEIPEQAGCCQSNLEGERQQSTEAAIRRHLSTFRQFAWSTIRARMFQQL
jgi:hypothetical protein